MKKKIQQGFTLVEMMIAVAIVGILSAISIPAYQDYIARAQVSEALSFASKYKTDSVEFFATMGYFNPEIQRLAYDGNYISNCGCVRPTIFPDGTVMIVFGNNASRLLAARAVILKPVVKNGNISWECGGAYYAGGDYYAVSDQKYMPQSCRSINIAMELP